jgi:hypothetical protein
VTDSPCSARARRWPFAASVAAVATVVAVAAANGGELPGELCGGHDAGAATLSFVVESGAALHERLPHLGITPELDMGDGPLSVVVFEAPQNALPRSLSFSRATSPLPPRSGIRSAF